MRTQNAILLLMGLLLGVFFVQFNQPQRVVALTPAPFAPACAAEETIRATEEATAAPTYTPTPTVEPDIITFTDFEPFDLKFNPTPEKPFAVVMNFTLFLQNQTSETLEVRKPQFALAIEGVEWGELASTDFQIGHMQGKARHGIVLQSLTLIRKATPEQLAVLECIKAGLPVDVVLTGTIDIYPQDEKQTISVEMAVDDLLFSEATGQD